jgi:hypothetical protein
MLELQEAFAEEYEKFEAHRLLSEEAIAISIIVLAFIVLFIFL